MISRPFAPSSSVAPRGAEESVPIEGEQIEAAGDLHPDPPEKGDSSSSADLVKFWAMHTSLETGNVIQRFDSALGIAPTFNYYTDMNSFGPSVPGGIPFQGRRALLDHVE